MSMIWAASRSFRVRWMSGVLGAGSPLGWLCAAIMAAADARIAARKTSRGWASAQVNVPSDTRVLPSGRFLRSSMITQNASCVGVSSKADFRYSETSCGVDSATTLPCSIIRYEMDASNTRIYIIYAAQGVFFRAITTAMGPLRATATLNAERHRG